MRKKLAAIGLLFSLMLILSGCGSEQPAKVKSQINNIADIDSKETFESFLSNHSAYADWIEAKKIGENYSNSFDYAQKNLKIAYRISEKYKFYGAKAIPELLKGIEKKPVPYIPGQTHLESIRERIQSAIWQKIFIDKYPYKTPSMISNKDVHDYFMNQGYKKFDSSGLDNTDDKLLTFASYSKKIIPNIEGMGIQIDMFKDDLVVGIHVSPVFNTLRKSSVPQLTPGINPYAYNESVNGIWSKTDVDNIVLQNISRHFNTPNIDNVRKVTEYLLQKYPEAQQQLITELKQYSQGGGQFLRDNGTLSENRMNWSSKWKPIGNGLSYYINADQYLLNITIEQDEMIQVYKTWSYSGLYNPGKKRLQEQTVAVLNSTNGDSKVPTKVHTQAKPVNEVSVPFDYDNASRNISRILFIAKISEIDEYPSDTPDEKMIDYAVRYVYSNRRNLIINGKVMLADVQEISKEIFNREVLKPASTGRLRFENNSFKFKPGRGGESAKINIIKISPSQNNEYIVEATVESVPNRMEGVTVGSVYGRIKAKFLRQFVSGEEKYVMLQYSFVRN